MNELIINFGIPLLIIFLGGLYLRNLFSRTSKEKCSFCNKKLGEDYYNDKCFYKDLGDELLWSHKKCIPQGELKEWKKTE